MPTDVQFGVLGPLEARVGGAVVPLGGPKQRALLAMLVLHAGDVVPLDRLIESLWEETAPQSAPAYVQNCVARLRKLLGHAAVETVTPGYRLRVEPDAIDSHRFEHAVRRARTLPTRERASGLRDALALWRGEALSDLAYWSFAQEAIRNLEEARVTALEQRLEDELELGLHRESIGELEALAREHPTRERLRWLQMLALHRAERRLEALAAYQETRLAIVEESGLEPGEELRALHRRILQDDPELMPSVAPEEVVAVPPRLARKVVAVCIAELLVGGELDVEAARGPVSRGLAVLEEIVVRHGGTVEQLLGEEAIAVFGFPAAHEDDVLRALRSAVELRDALGSRSLRAGIETGEVLVGDDGRVLSGGALTTARKVKEAAGEGEILLGSAAAAQSAGAAWTEPLAGGHRLVELVEGAPAIARRPDTPLIGRRAELDQLVVGVRESAAAATCRRIVVLGEPGIGKTRLASELVVTVAHEARVLVGRCVPYAEGATYLLLGEIVEQIAAGDDLGHAILAMLSEEPDGERAATRLADALSGAAAVDSGDVFWSTRKLLETLARERPLLVVLEDVHWAEPTFLDLLEYLVGWSAGAPIALVCLARTELLDARPAWASDTLVLRPLADEETANLLDALPESLALDPDARAAVVSVAEGNPLFLEQLAAHALDGPLEPGHVPASLESLLASRLDHLAADERGVLERAAIVGREFTRAAVDALSPDDERGSATALLALVRRRLVRPDTERTPDDAFLFDHALIRDATYAGVSKTERARLHEQLARWLDERGDVDESVGHHLEQSALSRSESGVDAAALSREAADRLARAGERAEWSRDHRAAVRLLTRAAALLGEMDPRRLEIECVLSIPLKNLWERDRALELVDDVMRRATEIGHARLETRAWIEQLWPRLDVVSDRDDVVARLVEAASVCEAAGDELGVARAWHIRMAAEGFLHGRYDAAAAAARCAADTYSRIGAGGYLDSILVAVMADGSSNLADVVAYAESRLGAGETSRGAEGLLLADLGVLQALRGELDSARSTLEQSRERLLDVGDDVAVATKWSICASYVSVLASDLRRAEEIVVPALHAAQDHSDRAHQAILLGLRADIALIDGDHAGALAFADEAGTIASLSDSFWSLSWRRVRSLALARLGENTVAERLALESVDLADSTDHLLLRGEARVLRAEVLAAAGRNEEAAQEAEEGAALLEMKGATLLADRARERIAELVGGEPGNRAPLEHA